ncbi:MAG TPA: serine hydrolase [Aggregatilineales bacterium]|nr:serine hydrolase [Aggregatilineales bacterium]
MPRQMHRIVVRFVLLIVGLSLTLGESVSRAQTAPTPEFRPELQDAILRYMVANQFVPGRAKQAAVYVLDLATGRSFTVNGNKAFSAASVTKVAVMVAFYRQMAVPPTAQQAHLLADMMICSENVASNQVIALDGGGDESAGLAYINDTLARLGFKNTFVWRHFYDDPKKALPQTPPPPTTEVDQTNTDPDPLNQGTPDEIGMLFADIYYCARDGSGPLTAAFPNEITVDECRAMMAVMEGEQLTVEIQAGIPAGTPIAQKTGVTSEVHNDAAIIMTPGGDYVLVEMMHNRLWLSYLDSFPVMAEISRMVYNSYNPSAPLAAVRDRGDNSCKIDKALLSALRQGHFPPIR